MFTANDANGGGVKIHWTAKQLNLAAKYHVNDSRRCILSRRVEVTFAPGRVNEGERPMCANVPACALRCQNCVC